MNTTIYLDENMTDAEWDAYCAGEWRKIHQAQADRAAKTAREYSGGSMMIQAALDRQAAKALARADGDA